MAAGAGAIQILQKSLEAARKDLTSTNDAIKRLTGRDPTAKPVSRISNPERRVSSGEPAGREGDRRITAPIRIERRFSGHGRESERRISGGAATATRNDGGRMRAWVGGDREDGPSAKRRDLIGSRSRLAGRLGPAVGEQGGGAGPRRGEGRERGARPRVGSGSSWRESKHQNSDGEDNEEKDSMKPSLQSSVVATKVPPRPNADPNEDEKSKKRNRRMFGFLMGTLQKFKDSEDVAKKSDKEKRRAEIEEKLDQQRELEKETAMQARKELFQELKSKKTKIARINYQMTTVQMYEEWNAHDKKLLGYIKTKATPPIFYLPAGHTSKTEQLLKETTSAIETTISERQKEVESFLAEGGEGENTKTEDSFAELEVDNLGEVEEDKGEGRREGSDSNDGSDKEP